MGAPIDIGFLWIDDISIEFATKRPNSKLQLRVSADVMKQKYEIRTSGEKTIRRVTKDKIPCGKTKEIVIELYQCKCKYIILKEKVQIFFMKMALDDDELYTKKTYTNDDNSVRITITFAYTSGGELRGSVEEARRITEETKLVLDKVRHIHRFFHDLEAVCKSVGDVHPCIRAASFALLSLYRLCKTRENCRNAARVLVNEMSDLLNNDLEELSNVLRVRSNTKTAFKSIVKIVEEISEFVKEQNKETISSLRAVLSSEPRIVELREKFKRAKAGLNDSITYGLWELAVDDHLKNDLKFVSSTHFLRGAGCLPGTRTKLQASVDTWARDPNTENMAWIHGHAGSGKSALLNSIARNLEKAYIPFTYFTCKRDDAERSDVQRILLSVCYDLTRYYDDYRDRISNTVEQPEGHSIATADVATQMELLFGVSPSYEVVSPTHAQRPPVHVILIDGLDECKDVRGRNTFAMHLRDLANGVPWIKVIVSSRPESDMTDVFESTSPYTYINSININDDEWDTSADIRLFIEAQSARLNLRLWPAEVDRFQEKASGLFIWCTTVFKYIEESKETKSRTVTAILEDDPPDSTDNPHASLYSLYQHIISSAARDHDKELLATVLGAVFIASNHMPLSTAAIADILFPNEQDEELEKKREWVTNVVKSLSAIVYIEEGGTNAVRACHGSVLDYIGGALDGKSLTMTVPSANLDVSFSVRLGEIYARILGGCFKIMERGLRFNICDLEDSSQLNEDVSDLPARIKQNISEALQYAIMFWISHLKHSGSMDSSERVFAFLNSLKALFWVEALSLLGAIDRGIVALQDCSSFFAAEPNVADIANEWERFLSAYGDASKSTPHLYLSALSWIPSGSPLLDIIRSPFSSALSIIANVPESWHCERWSGSLGASVGSVAYSLDGHFFAAGCEDSSVQLWNARSKIRERFMTESPVWSIAISPDGHWIASGHHDGVRVWDLRFDTVIPRVLEGHIGWARSVAFSSDGRRVVSDLHNKTIMVWDVESGTAIGSPFKGHTSWVSSVTFSPDDTHIVSGSGDGTVRTWNAETGEQIGESLRGHSHWVNSVACSRDGKFIASGSMDKTVRLWDAETHEQVELPLAGHNDCVNSVCFSLDGRYLVTGSDDRSVRVWNIETRSLISELRGHTSGVSSVAFSRDGRNILSGSSDGTVRIWDFKEAASSGQPSTTASAQVLCVSYVPHSNLIVSGSSDNNVRIWDAHTGAAVGRPMQGHTDAVWALAVSNDGQWLVSGSYDKTLRIWDISSGTMLGEALLGHTDAINSVAISPNSQLVVSASDDNTVRLWDVKTLKMTKTLKGHENRVTSVVFSVDGNYAISGSRDKTLRVWDTQTGKVVGYPLSGHSDRIEAVAVSPNGQWFTSSSWGGTVQIWSMSTRSVIHVLKGHSDWVKSVSFSPDSQLFISASFDRTFKVWNAKTGKAVGDALKGHTAWIHSVSFAANGHEFASASKDGTIRVWDTRVRTDLELQRKRNATYSGLSEEELRTRWNASRARMSDKNDGWVREGGKLLLWVPQRYRSDLEMGVITVVGSPSENTKRPNVDYQRLFRYSGAEWTKICIDYA